MTDKPSPDADPKPESLILDPLTDVILYRSGTTSPVTATRDPEGTDLCAHPVSGKATCFYLFYRSQPFHEPVIHPLADQYEAAAFIIGLAGMELAGITDAEQKRIRNYFPDVFGYGDK